MTMAAQALSGIRVTKVIEVSLASQDRLDETATPANQAWMDPKAKWDSPDNLGLQALLECLASKVSSECQVTRSLSV